MLVGRASGWWILRVCANRLCPPVITGACLYTHKDTHTHTHTHTHAAVDNSKFASLLQPRAPTTTAAGGTAATVAAVLLP